MHYHVVCSGNYERSVIAEAILSDLQGEISSSGTRVKEYIRGNIPTADALYYIEQSLRLGLWSGKQKTVENLDKPEDIRKYFLMANKKMLDLAKKQQAEAISQLGLDLKLKGYRTQTRPGYHDLVLCMTREHEEYVQRTYRNTEIVLFGDKTEVPDTFCGGVDAYRENIRLIRYLAEKLVPHL